MCNQEERVLSTADHYLKLCDIRVNEYRSYKDEGARRVLMYSLGRLEGIGRMIQTFDPEGCRPGGKYENVMARIEATIATKID